MNLKGKIAIVTGAASGIGRALALELAGKGCHLALSDINEKKLNDTLREILQSGVEAKVYQLDVSQRPAWASFAEQLHNDFPHVDLLFNNAGIALDKLTIEQSTIEEIEKILSVNLWGVIYGTKQFLPHLKERPEAAVVNISSLFGLVGISHQGAYCTSKFAVRGFTECLRAEMARTNVHVMSVHPGGIATNIARNAITRRAGDPVREKEIANFEKVLRLSPGKAAKEILHGVYKKRGRVLVGSDARFIDKLIRWFPSSSVMLLKKFADRMIEEQD